jgi:hypothetical protein
MDIRLFGRVLWRFKLMTAVGLLLAIGLAFLSYVRVTFPHGSSTPRLAFRQSEQWVGYSTILVTQRGLPWGRSVILTATPGVSSVSPTGGAFADPSRFSSLAILYAQLADSDPVRAILHRMGGGNGKIEAAPVLVSQGGTDALPLISIAAISPTPKDALLLANRETAAFGVYLVRQQADAGIPTRNRVLLNVVKRADQAKLLKGRSKSLPIVIFLALAVATTGVAFALENMRPRIRSVPKTREQPATAGSVASGQQTA